MAVAKFMSARVFATVRNTQNRIWKLGTFGMHVSRGNYGYFLTRTELARVLRSHKEVGRFTGFTGQGKNTPFVAKYEFVKADDGGLQLGCQNFSPMAVETLKQWAGV